MQTADFTPKDRMANGTAVFHPARYDGEDYEPQYIEFGGIKVYAYTRMGVAVIAVEFGNADPQVFELYDDGAKVPLAVQLGDAPRPMLSMGPDDPTYVPRHAVRAGAL